MELTSTRYKVFIDSPVYPAAVLLSLEDPIFGPRFKACHPVEDLYDFFDKSPNFLKELPIRRYWQEKGEHDEVRISRIDLHVDERFLPKLQSATNSVSF